MVVVVCVRERERDTHTRSWCPESFPWGETGCVCVCVCVRERERERQRESESESE